MLDERKSGTVDVKSSDSMGDHLGQTAGIRDMRGTRLTSEVSTSLFGQVGEHFGAAFLADLPLPFFSLSRGLGCKQESE